MLAHGRIRRITIKAAMIIFATAYSLYISGKHTLYLTMIVSSVKEFDKTFIVLIEI